MKPDKALECLRAGNRRFVSGETTSVINRTPDGETPLPLHRQRAALVNTQSPVAVVLGCSDSRVPPELIFDLGLGELFVVRVAGNVAGPTQVETVEFAVAVMKVPLVVVMGHSGCVAVGTALSTPDGDDPAVLATVVAAIRAEVAPFQASHPGLEGEALARRAVQVNARGAARGLLRDSADIAGRVATGRVRVLGAEYDLETGVVEYFDVD